MCVLTALVRQRGVASRRLCRPRYLDHLTILSDTSIKQIRLFRTFLDFF
jgi:hypothetical protein